MATLVYSTRRPSLPVVFASPDLLFTGLRFAYAGSPTSSSNADDNVQAIRERAERYLGEAAAVVAQHGIAYRRRGAWAAFSHTVERVEQLPSAREVTAALGGAA